MAHTEPFSLEGVPCMGCYSKEQPCAYKLVFGGSIRIVVCKQCMANVLKTHGECVDKSGLALFEE